MNIVDRAGWGARHGRGGHVVASALDEVILHHSWKPHLQEDATRTIESSAVRGIEHFHVQTNGWAGIGYNWLAAPSGRVYEGRGWGRTGAHTEGRNSRSVGICLLMDGDRFDPTPAAIAAVRQLTRDGIGKGHITPGYQLRGHRDYSSKTCPGDRVYPRLREFHVDGGRPGLQRGARGRDVVKLQTSLSRLGHKLSIDGAFGPRTESAVRAFQADRGMPVTGVVDEATWARLG